MEFDNDGNLILKNLNQKIVHEEDYNNIQPKEVNTSNDKPKN